MTTPYVTKETQTLAEKLLPKERQFVEILVAGGVTMREAYISAGYEEQKARHDAWRLLRRNADVKNYYNHLLKLRTAKSLQKMAESVKRIASKEEVAARLTELGLANLVDFLGEDGQPVVSRDIQNNGALREYYHRSHKDSNGNPIVTKSIKLVDPVAALDKLCDVMGYKAPAKSAIAQRVEIIHQHYRYSKDIEEPGRTNSEALGENEAPGEGMRP